MHIVLTLLLLLLLLKNKKTHFFNSWCRQFFENGRLRDGWTALEFYKFEGPYTLSNVFFGFGVCLSWVLAFMLSSTSLQGMCHCHRNTAEQHVATATSHLLFRQLWWLCGSGWALASGCRVSSLGHSHQQCRADGATSCGSLQSAGARGEGHVTRELSRSDLKFFQAFHDTIMVDSQSIELNAVPSCSKWK